MQITDEAERIQMTRAMECPEGICADERNLASLSNTGLWSVELVRLLGCARRARSSVADQPFGIYDGFALYWHRHVLANLLGVPNMEEAEHRDHAIEGMIVVDNVTVLSNHTAIRRCASL